MLFLHVVGFCWGYFNLYSWGISVLRFVKMPLFSIREILGWSNYTGNYACLLDFLEDYLRNQYIFFLYNNHRIHQWAHLHLEFSVESFYPTMSVSLCISYCVFQKIKFIFQGRTSKFKDKMLFLCPLALLPPTPPLQCAMCFCLEHQQDLKDGNDCFTGNIDFYFCSDATNVMS